MTVNWNMDAAMKNGFPHFMLKEIHEQPDALRNTILPRVNKGIPDFGEDGIPDRIFENAARFRSLPAALPCMQEWWRVPLCSHYCAFL